MQYKSPLTDIIHKKIVRIIELTYFWRNIPVIYNNKAELQHEAVLTYRMKLYLQTLARIVM